MSEQFGASPAHVLRDLVPPEAWAALADHPRRSHPAGEILLRQGDSGTHVCALLQGMVKVVRTDADGRERLLAFRGPGEVLGEMAVQAGGHRLADVRTLSTCEVAVIPADTFRRFVKEYDLATQLATYAVNRLREQTRATEGAVGQRLAGTLLRLVEICGAHTLSLTREDLAQHLGVGRNSVTKALTGFGPRRVRTERTRIRVLDVPHLREVARGCTPAP
ncbi:Crp/Fnr family transcriptional regulator [Streptomyces catenulae]|uniref:Crp/Fnr family transcriptional regulator n=1 Tax=Streptomyces catenulae TaxID=66875 RepID=A0ABV2YS91_9ACTN|nr:Crp/Fnr family transcriptional regulator [Streptomyces catenulae]